MRTVRGGKRAGREGGLVVGAAGRGGWWEVRQGRDGGVRGGMRGEGGEDRLAEIGSWRMERREEGGGRGQEGAGMASRAMASCGGNCVVVADAGAGSVRGAGGGQVGASGWWVGGVMSFEVIVAGGIQQKWVCGVDSHGGGCAGCWVG